MNIVEHLKEAIHKIDSDLYYLDMTGPWCKEHTKLVREKRILKRTLRKIERLEVHNNDKHKN